MKRERRPDELEALWKEKDIVDGAISDAMVVIMRTRGCIWAKTGGCTMCGYRSASLDGVRSEDLLKQLDQALSKYRGEPFVKIYTSGSFLDGNEIPADVRQRILDSFSGCRRILLESRPEFVTQEVLSSLPRTVTIALGMETSDPEVMETSVRKGFTPEQSKAAGELVKRNGLKVRTYLLLKPLFMQEGASIESTVRSARFAAPFSDEISINPVNVQRGTFVERIWKRGDYRPPWIWSLIEVMKQLSGTIDSRIMSSPSGGGSMRGVHNCGECDQSALKAIERFSFSQDPKDLEVGCVCVEDWKKYMASEILLGTAADLDRGFEGDLTIRK